MYGSVYMPGDTDDCEDFHDASNMFLGAYGNLQGDGIQME